MEYDATPYESQQTRTGPPAIQPDKGYVQSVPGILKILEMFLCILAFICASINASFSWLGGGWVQFVTMSCFVTVLILFIFLFMGIIHRIPGPIGLIHFIMYIVMTVLLMISAIVAAARGWIHSSIIACAVFTFGATAVFAVDTFLMFRSWQSGTLIDNRGGATTVVTTTTTTMKEEY